jgi:hypothetical protein
MWDRFIRWFRNTFLIKGNITAEGVKVYYVPSHPQYKNVFVDVIKGERWFISEYQARKFNYRKAE